MIEADQVFAKAESRDVVVALLEELLGEDGFLRSESKLPLPARYTTASRKSFRHFYVAQPVSGWVCVLESRSGDKALAQKLSAGLATAAVWLSYSETAEQLECSVYSSGELSETKLIKPPTQRKPHVFSFTQRKQTKGEIALVEQGEELYKQYGLPWPFYSYEQIDHSPNKDEYFVHVNFAARTKATP